MTTAELLAASEKPLSVSELSKLTSISVGKINAMVRAGKIPHYKPGNMTRFDPAEIAAWWKKSKVV